MSRQEARQSASVSPQVTRSPRSTDALSTRRFCVSARGSGKAHQGPKWNSAWPTATPISWSWRTTSSWETWPPQRDAASLCSCIASRDALALSVMEHQEILAGFIRLHVLHHASEGEIYGQWMIEELAHHGYRM